MALDDADPYLPSLRVHHVTVFVRDQARSLAFYRDKLGFRVTADLMLPTGDRYILVEPHDGGTGLSLVAPTAESKLVSFIGRSGRTVLVTNDIHGQFQEWERKGVRFIWPPTEEIWGGVTAAFEDVDGNLFILAGWDAITREAEMRRLAEAERRAAQLREASELALAREVQSRLFPQVNPPIDSLEYAGICVQARAVGGDYYDFLDLGEGSLALVVGDVSGKGIAAALMMSNLQANLRSQCAVARDEPGRALRMVSRLFYENSPGSAFATLFFAQYDGVRQRLSYTNCGHPPAFLIRGSGVIEYLDSTAPIIGLFPEWDCLTQELVLEPGDTLVIVSDGVTEVFDTNGQEFGDERLISTLQEHRGDSPQAIIDAILWSLRRFSQTDQQDDITIVVARCRAS